MRSGRSGSSDLLLSFVSGGVAVAAACRSRSPGDCARTPRRAGLRKEGGGHDLSNSRRGVKQTIKRRLQFRYASTLERSHQATSLLRKSSAKHFCNSTALARTRCTGNMGRQIRCWSVVVQFAAKTNCWRSGARFLPRRAAAWCGICAGRSD